LADQHPIKDIDMTNLSNADVSAAPMGIQKLYFAAWRWHFYAGLFVVPFLLILAITGFFMMLFTTYLPEYGDRLYVAPQAQAMDLSQQTAAAIAAVSGGTHVGDLRLPYSDTTPTMITVSGPETPVVVALNPYTGEILRQTPQGQTWNIFFETIHGSLMIGKTGDILLEIAAGLGLVMIATGLYLTWPRGAGGWRAMLVPNFGAKGRAWWKSLHQVIGTWTAVLLAFFFVTGMAWASIWGEKWVQAWSTFPAEKWDNVPLSDKTHASMNHAGDKSVPWALEQTPMPESGSAAGMDILPEGVPVNLDSMAALGRALGIEGRFRITAPDGDTGVWTLSQNSMSYDGASPTIDRAVHIDQYTGRILADVRYADYSPAGKAMAVGIALHEGQVGLWNFLLNAVFLAMIVFTCISGIVMWWRRRPTGAMRLGAPPRPAELPLWKGAAVVTIVLSVMFPLVGAVLVAVLLLDILVLQNIPALKRALA
jgi:uncharacterized iron-regulated membrane protein